MIHKLMDGAKNAVQAATLAATDAINQSAKSAQNTLGTLGNFDLGDTFEKIKGGRDTIKDGIKELFSGKGLAQMVSDGIDKLGLPDWVGPAVGTVVGPAHTTVASARAMGLGRRPRRCTPPEWPITRDGTPTIVAHIRAMRPPGRSQWPMIRSGCQARTRRRVSTSIAPIAPGRRVRSKGCLAIFSGAPAP